MKEGIVKMYETGKTEERILWGRNALKTICYFVMFILYLKSSIAIGISSWLTLLPVFLIFTDKKSKSRLFEAILTASFLIVVNSNSNPTLVGCSIGAMFVICFAYFIRDLDK